MVAGAVTADEWAPPDEIDVRSRVAILPMVVNSMEEQGYLRAGLADMLGARLGRNPALAVIRVEDEARATTDPKRAAEVGLELGARYVVFGSFTQFGEGASLDVQCVEARSYEKNEDPAARRIFIQSGTVGEIIPKLDSTAQKISLFATGTNGTEGPASARRAEPAAGADVAASPAAAEPPADVAELRRRIEALEEYLFGSASDRVAGPAESPDSSQELRLR
jgi:TolB-like protein